MTHVFDFATANRIVFGAGRLAEVGTIAAQFGQKAFVLTGANSERANPLMDRLSEAGIATEHYSISHEPTVSLIQAATAQARQAECDLVIGFGGGSVLDSAKAVGALLTNSGDPLDYLEVIGAGKPLTQEAAPCIAIPTTAGTGSEVTRNAVLASPDHQVKVSLRSTSMLPNVALVDPELTYNLPPALTASTGMDAVVQLIEPLVSNQANPLTDGIAWEGLNRAVRSLRRAFDCGEDDQQARMDMALASLLGGIALANAKLGAVHGFAGVLGGMFDAPHGAICAILLPATIQVNVRALQERAPSHKALMRYVALSQKIIGREDVTIDEGVAHVEELLTYLQIPGLSQFGISEAHFSSIIPKAAESSSMKGNPIELTTDELTQILQKSL